MEVYFDNATTSYPKPEAVYQAVDHFMREVGGLPGRETHRRGQQAGRLVQLARERLAKLFHVKDSARIVFTANATEALNLGLKGLLSAGDHVVTTNMEHDSVIRPLLSLRNQGVELSIVPCGPAGELDPGDIVHSLRSHTRLVVVGHASNVTGTIVPIGEIGAIAHAHGSLFMVNAAQTAGRVPIDVEAQQIDLLAFTGHKGLLGPQGTGGLYIREEIALRPLKEGGADRRSENHQPDSMPEKFESGSLNAMGLAGLAAGVGYVLEKGVERILAHERRLTRRLLDKLRGLPSLTLYGLPDENERIGIVSFNLAGRLPKDVGLALDIAHGIIVATGLHCAPMAHETIGSFLRGGAVRLSFSIFNTLAEVDYAADCIAQMAREHSHRPAYASRLALLETLLPTDESLQAYRYWRI